MRLAGKTALVTGGTSGIGRAIAEAFAHEGAQVVVAGRDEGRGQEVVDGILQQGGHAAFVRADLADSAEAARLARAAEEPFGPLDIVVNNAGIYSFAPTADTDEASFDAMIAVNVKAPFILTGAIAPGMAARGRGAVINISTMVAQVGMAGAAAYGASKAALELLTKSWATEFGPHGVNVNTIAPGPVRTPGTAAMSAVIDHVASTLPAGRAAEPEEVAAAAVYLASDESRFVHGATLAIDGGGLAT